MKLVWTQIKNFRSIKDSGKIYFNPNLTILAGKNESGKSNILKALECFSLDKFNKDTDFPIDYIEEEYPEVIVHYQLEEDIVIDLCDTLKINKENAHKISGVTVTRTSEFLESIEVDIFKDTLEYVIDAVGEAIKVINRELKRTFKLDINSKSSYLLSDLIEKIDSYLLTIKEFFNEEQSNKLNSIIEEVVSHLEMLNGFSDYISDKKFKATIPNFIYFSSFEDIIPDSISSNEEITPIVNRFFKVVNQNPKLLFDESNPQRRRLLSDKISAGISGDFMDYYSQDSVSLKINLDGDDLNFFVYGTDTQKPFQPRQRSQGLQWFLSFYLTLQAEMKTGSVLLIDEPGLYLHASAQEDLLGMLNNLSDKSPIVISTHSHWLMDPNRLERIRLVLKVNDQTQVENKIHKGADAYTMKPIFSAIGLGLNNDISTFGERLILVEGYSDYYYLEAMRYYFQEILGIKIKKFKIYPCLGSAQIINVLTLLVDSETEYFILLDNDKAGRQTEKKLKAECGIDENKILFTPVKSKNTSVIEDMFSQKDFSEIILDSLDTNKFDKVLVSKKFNERMHNNEITILSDETVSNFKEILDVVATPKFSHREN
ncbi:AAA family ATPase [Paenibacillus sp. FSL R7-0198]|uniref:ATP-dependent nuclease n=1 Tax=Paenibacillus sp. FSL R7-0198 TaxID=2921674 RepID=UPI0030FBBB92